MNRNNVIVIVMVMMRLLLLCSIGSAVDFSSIYDGKNSNDVNYAQVEKIHDAQRHFNLVQQTNNYYAILVFDREIRQKADEGILSWSDLEVQDEIEYSLIVCDARQRAAIAAWQSIKEGNISSMEGELCGEIILSAIDQGDIDWDKDLDGMGENTMWEIISRLPIETEVGI